MNGRVVIIGGGISGLAAAWWLRQRRVHAIVLEKEPAPGGTMRSIEEGGWLIETGPNSALDTTPLFNRMFEGLGILEERMYADPLAERRYILRDGTLHPLPMSPPAFLKSNLWTTAGKLRLLKEPFIGRAEKEESIAEFVKRRLGQEFLDYAINPFVAGVYAGNPEELSVRSAFPKLYALEEQYGGLVKGMVKGRKKRKHRAEQAKDRAKMFSFKRGMQTFPDAIARALQDDLVLNAAVSSIEDRMQPGGGGRFTVSFSERDAQRTLDADVVILATPAYTAGNLVRNYSEKLAQSMEGIYYPPLCEVFMGFETRQIQRQLDGFGYLIPAKEHKSILGTIWSSSLFPHRAPAGHVALTTFVGGARQPHLATLADDDLAARVLHDLDSIMHIAGEPVYRKILRWPKAIPQYNLGYQAIIDRVEVFEANHPGWFFCSNFRGGIAVGDCVMSAETIAGRIVSFMQTNRTSSSHSIGVS